MQSTIVWRNSLHSRQLGLALLCIQTVPRKTKEEKRCILRVIHVSHRWSKRRTFHRPRRPGSAVIDAYRSALRGSRRNNVTENRSLSSYWRAVAHVVHNFHLV